MNLAQVEAMLAVADELHFGRSAQRLALSQSRVSRLVASLEVEVGGALFERTSRRVALTPLGTQLRDRLAPAYGELLAAMEQARATARSTRGALRIAFTATTDGPSVIGLVEALQQSHPEIDVSLHEVEVFDPLANLRQGEVDVLVNWLATDDLDIVLGPAIEYRARMLAVAPGHRLAARRSVSHEELAQEVVSQVPSTFPPALYDYVMPPHTAGGKPIRRTFSCRTIHEVLSAVARGQIVHLTVDSVPLFARDDIVLVPIEDLPPLSLGLLWCRPHENARIRALVEVASEMAPPTTGRRTGRVRTRHAPPQLRVPT